MASHNPERDLRLYLDYVNGERSFHILARRYGVSAATANRLVARESRDRGDGLAGVGEYRAERKHGRRGNAR